MNTPLHNKLLKRLKIMAGQIKGIEKMLESDAYCVDIIVQASAVKNSLSSFADAVLENHLGTHVKHQIKSGEDQKAIEEIMKIHRLSTR